MREEVLPVGVLGLLRAVAFVLSMYICEEWGGGVRCWVAVTSSGSGLGLARWLVRRNLRLLQPLLRMGVENGGGWWYRDDEYGLEAGRLYREWTIEVRAQAQVVVILCVVTIGGTFAVIPVLHASDDLLSIVCSRPAMVLMMIRLSSRGLGMWNAECGAEVVTAWCIN